MIQGSTGFFGKIIFLFLDELEASHSDMPLIFFYRKSQPFVHQQGGEGGDVTTGWTLGSRDSLHGPASHTDWCHPRFQMGRGQASVYMCVCPCVHFWCPTLETGIGTCLLPVVLVSGSRIPCRAVLPFCPEEESRSKWNYHTNRRARGSRDWPPGRHIHRRCALSILLPESGNKLTAPAASLELGEPFSEQLRQAFHLKVK